MRPRPLVASFALFALALVLPLAIVAVTATAWYVDSENRRLRGTATLIGEEIRERVDRELSEMEAVARTLATSPSIETGDLAAFRAQALASVAAADITVTLAELDGRQLVNTRSASDAALPATPRPELVAQITQTRRPTVSELLTSRLTGRPIVSVIAPVIRDGQVVRTVAVVVQAEHFEPLIRHPQMAGPYWAAMLDRGGTVVARAGEGVDLPDGQTLRAAVTAAETGISARADGFLNVLQTSQRSDWRVVAGVDRAALEAPLRHSLALLLALALALVGFGGLIALHLARRIAREATGLAAKVEAIGRGETVTAEDSPIREARMVGSALAQTSRALADERAAHAAAQAGLAAKVEASETLYRTVAESIGDIVVLRRLGQDGLFYTSPSFARMLGYDAQARASLTLPDLIHPDDAAAVAARDVVLGTGTVPAAVMLRARHRDGHWLRLECVSALIAGAGPSEPDVISVLRDVTARQQQADEFRIACDVAELARAKAENANRAKSEFLAVMSHEIRTPLATIHGYTELLAGSGPLSPEQARYLAMVTEATGTMLTAVDDILDFAHIESGEIRLEEEPFALAGAVERVVTFARPIAAGRGVALGLTIDPNLPPLVQGDPRRLRQILLNLLNASLRERRGGLVTLSIYASGGAEARISFALTGSGGRRQAPAQGGEREGLGLRIAGRLVARMGGRLETLSFTGETQSYRFGLPLAEAAAETAPAAALAKPIAKPIATPIAAPVAALPPGSGAPTAHLLLVEDHSINQEMTRHILERAGYRVDVVDDGAAAVAAVQRQVYDLVLMDVQMPGMDGLAATRRIRALPHPSRHVPIVAFTAEVLPDQVRAILAAGMNAHIAKPIDRARLRAVIDEQLASVVLAQSLPARADDEPIALPLAIDRGTFDRLAVELGPERARGTLRGYLGLLDATFAVPATLRAEAATLAAGARRLGLADLAAALGELAGGFHGGPGGHPGGGLGATGEAALRRAQAARGLVERSLDELLGPQPVPLPSRVA